MLTEKNFKESLSQLLQNFEQRHFLLAVSGGADSMVLLHLFHTLGLRFQVAHVNYKLRGEESYLDQKTVQEYCSENHIKFHLYEISEKDRQPEASVQLWARELRYEFFREIQQQENLELLVTGHHLNDNLETFLINLSRGSGIRGLSGIPAKENKILRPLLPFSKEDIYAFAEQNKIEFREDLSNQKNDYLRNKIRNDIIPGLLETNIDFLKNFEKSLGYLNQLKNFAEEKIEEIADGMISEKDSEIIIAKEKLLRQTGFVQFEILRRFGFDKDKEIVKILTAEKGKIFNSSNFKLTVDSNELILQQKSQIRINIFEEEILLRVIKENQIIIPQKVKAQIADLGSLEWKFDAEKLSLPLKLRKKEDGDVFFPIGMTGKKKISKFFKDEKLSILARPNIWLICDRNDEVLGVIPLRQDRRFIADEHTKKVLRLTL